MIGEIRQPRAVPTPRTVEHHPVTCPACDGLKCLCRPHFSDGQLLAAEDLRGLIEYVREKNKLQNRFLHGPGVVCGLEVTCHDCEGWVTVGEGYAIDPCGNDIVLCDDRDFNLIDHIQKCRRTHRREDCDPIWGSDTHNCREEQEYWCLTVSYEERQARRQPALRPGTTDTCGCCRGNGHSCGCGCHHQYRAQPTSTQINRQRRPGSGQLVAYCEPTLVCEGYCLDVVKVSKSYCSDILRGQLEDTFFGRAVACLKVISEFINSRMPKGGVSALFPAFLPASSISFDNATAVAPTDQYENLCRLYEAVRDLYVQNPYNVRCSLRDTLKLIDCPTPSPSETATTYNAKISATLYQLVALIVQYILDCICHALLPPCPTEPDDDRLILACVTIKNDKIDHICNFSCRQHSGAAPSVSYWISIVPLIAQYIQRICCRPSLVRANSPLVNDFADFLTRIDPDGSLRQAVLQDDMALPNQYLERLGQTLSQFTVTGLAASLRSKDVNAAALVNKSPTEAEVTLSNAGVVPVWRDVASADEVPVFKALTTNPFLARGDRVVVYRTADKIVGFGRYDPKDEGVGQTVEMEVLRKELAALKSEVAALKRGPK